MIKHYIFLLYDMIVVILSFFIANLIRFGLANNERTTDLYIQVMGLAVVSCFVINRIFRIDHHVFDRGYFAEFVAVVKCEIGIAMALLFYLYFSQEGQNYARLQMGYYFIAYFILSYFGRLVLKKLVAVYYRNSRSYKQILLVTTTDKVEGILDKLDTTNN